MTNDKKHSSPVSDESGIQNDCHSETNFNSSDPTTRALTNDVILSEIFQFFTFDDHKRCRWVCRKWKFVSDPSFKKQSQVCLDFGEDEEKSILFSFSLISPPEDLVTFFKIANEVVPFRNLRLSFKLLWSDSKLIKFFETEGRFIEHLTLNDVILPVEVDDQGHFHKFYNLSSLTSGHLPNIQRLVISINTENVNFTHFILSLEDLQRMKYIRLEKCTVELTNDVIISPVELVFRDIVFHRNGVAVGTEGVLVNQFVKFTEMNSLQLCVNKLELFTHLKLDMSGKVCMESVIFTQVDLLNVETSNWNIELLGLIQIPFLVRSNWIVRCFNMQHSELKLCCLPQSVKTLSIGIVDISDVVDYYFRLLPFLPNLQSLEIKGFLCVSNIFPALRRLNKLEVLHMDLDPNLDIPFPVDVNRFPRSLKRLILSGDEFEFVGNDILPLDELVINTQKLYLVKSALRYFNTKSIFVNVPNLNSNNGYAMLSILLSKPFSRVALGAFKWKQGEIIENLRIGRFVKSLGEAYWFDFEGGFRSTTTMKSLHNEFDFSLA